MMDVFNFNKFGFRKIKLICFDLDNTLYDYSVAEAETEPHIMSMLHKISGSKKKNIKIGDMLKQFNEVKRSHMHHDIEPQKFSRGLWIKETAERLDIAISEKRILDLEKEYWDYLIPRIKLFPNTLDTIQKIKNSGKYILALLTDSDGKKEFKIRRINDLGLGTYFDYVITTDDTGKNKPSIHNFEYIEKISGINPKNCMMIGDHPDVDLMNAKKRKWVTVWTKEHIPSDLHFKYVDHEVSDIAEILNVLKRY